MPTPHEYAAAQIRDTFQPGVADLVISVAEACLADRLPLMDLPSKLARNLARPGVVEAVRAYRAAYERFCAR